MGVIWGGVVLVVVVGRAWEGFGRWVGIESCWSGWSGTEESS